MGLDLRNLEGEPANLQHSITMSEMFTAVFSFMFLVVVSFGWNVVFVRSVCWFLKFFFNFWGVAVFEYGC
jgi:hypothetical protein